jgi:hypothetical protein
MGLLQQLDRRSLGKANRLFGQRLRSILSRLLPLLRQPFRRSGLQRVRARGLGREAQARPRLELPPVLLLLRLRLLCRWGVGLFAMMAGTSLAELALPGLLPARHQPCLYDSSIVLSCHQTVLVPGWVTAWGRVDSPPSRHVAMLGSRGKDTVTACGSVSAGG